MAFFGGILLVLVLIGAMFGGTDDTSDPTSQAAPADTSTHTLPTVARTEASSSTSPPTTAADVEVPKLVGMTTRTAKNIFADRGLHWRATYRATSRYASGTVISQSKPTGGDVRAGATVNLVIPKRRRLPHHRPRNQHHHHPRPIATRPIPATAFLHHRLIWIAPTSATASKSTISTATRIAWMPMAMASAATAGDNNRLRPVRGRIAGVAITVAILAMLVGFN